MKSVIASMALVAGLAVAAPLESAGAIARRYNGLSDAAILQFALTLEHLEDTFYREALAKYTQADFDAIGAVPRLRFNFGEVSYDETTHVSFLTSALTAAGVKPVAACTYDFGLTDVTSFLETARTLEGVGVSAYLGAAMDIANPAYLTAAGSILTIEARHNAYIRDNQVHPQSFAPNPFDTPLNPNDVYSLASQFITSCPSTNADLGLTAFPVLAAGVETLVPARAGQTAVLRTSKFTIPSGKYYCAWPAVAGPYFTDATISQAGTRVTCTIPNGVAGQAYAILTDSNTEINGHTITSPAIIQVQSPYTYGGFPM